MARPWGDADRHHPSRLEVKKRWAAILHQSIDGSSLKNSHQVTGQHQWVADGTSLLSGRNYIICQKVSIGALPTRSRTTRGRRGDRLCRARCIVQETNSHLLQGATFDGRVLNNGHTWAGDRCPNCLRAVWPRKSQDCQNQEIRRQSWHRTGHTAWNRSNQHPSPTGHPLLEGYLVQNIRIRFSDTGHHHPERSRCHRHPDAHRWYHRPLWLQSVNRGHVRKMTSPKEDHHPNPSVLPAVLRHKLLYLNNHLSKLFKFNYLLQYFNISIFISACWFFYIFAFHQHTLNTHTIETPITAFWEKFSNFMRLCYGF